MQKLKNWFKSWVKRNLVDVDPEHLEEYKRLKTVTKKEFSTDWLVNELKKLSENGETVRLTFSKLEELAKEAKNMERDNILKASIYDPFLGNLPEKEGKWYLKNTFK